ncbi:hypothetical protein V8G54_029132 [Vigna mungo]|uniref:Uncharacterized protein n=1 Tax=Vigna mungo TaxID=3915 RepID=A0AAQ3MTY7_VIGMU
MHIDITPNLQSLPRFFISCNSVATHRAPVAPRGCPIAIAPPLTLIFSGSSPSLFRQYTNWEANASFISKRSISSSSRPAALTATGIAAAGPTPMMAGSTPTAVKVLDDSQ